MDVTVIVGVVVAVGGDGDVNGCSHPTGIAASAVPGRPRRRGPRGDPPPVAFNESLNWLDEQGRAVRYVSTYVNIPDVPKPAPRGTAPVQ